MEGSWNPRDYLAEVSYERARLSSGFLQAEMSKFFPKLTEIWRPLFFALGIKEPAINYQLLLEQSSLKNFDGFTAGYEINSLPGYISIDPNSVEIITQAITSNKLMNASGDIIISYLLRRFLVSLEKAWVGVNKIKVAYSETMSEAINEIPATVKINLELNDKIASIVFGIPLNLVEIFNQAALNFNKTNLSEKTELSIELFGVFVPPDALLDYLRSGTIIKDSKPFTDNVNLYANGRPWAQGILKTCQDKFAIEISNLIFPKIESSTGNTRISVQLERIPINQDIKSYKTLGSIILTDLRLNSPLSLFVSGEKIASANMNIDDDNYSTLKLLSKY
jgi:hypothetical protein